MFFNLCHALYTEILGSFAIFTQVWRQGECGGGATPPGLPQWSSKSRKEQSKLDELCKIAHAKPGKSNAIEYANLLHQRIAIRKSLESLQRAN